MFSIFTALVFAVAGVTALYTNVSSEMAAEKDCTCAGVFYKGSSEVRLAVAGSRSGKYPADFYNKEMLALVNHADCVQATNPQTGLSNLLEFPLQSGGQYKGGVPSADRAIYNRGTTRFCGCVHHPVNSGSFVLCAF